MSTPPLPRPHSRAVRQLLLGLVPVLVVGAVLLVAVGLRVGGARAPLAAATATATATVDGERSGDRVLVVRFPGTDGEQRTGRIELTRAQDVPDGAQLPVQYDPDRPAGGTQPVYADGDRAHAAVAGAVFGLVAVGAVVLVVAVLTGLRLLGRPRLRRRPASRLAATHVVQRQGLLVRSWLELTTPAGVRRVPVHWAPELERLAPGTRIEVRGDPARDRLVLPVVDGAELWPSGRVRDRAPRGEVRQAAVDASAGDVGLARQARADGVLVVLAPVLGLLWAYVDGSGLAGFAVATALSGTVLFWLPQLLGSDPRATSRAA
ncbi:DUF3592 domain-containing protein [Modestobacter sp. NPDC049651]|uniref:DUF3592 domain-containing protein n=1 Tax=unclassified Modestobacter TaxID=2643866 RepID=UPI00340C4444